ncbi:6-phosphogluconolactonase [Methylobacillus rhizosphaerae]|uniref:6-phosphogluconolactonase n=1 Tax=Methylobacillus rhizosphaerae TaxID=551994 RepID=A0A238YXH1_9PROT|nr:6-phosphogluconolactonase [Methylobacillus rhizosphaerae]SNR75461.1 6-phosphogluconolactonase [Methylobacillus rhizosphaerae]
MQNTTQSLVVNNQVSRWQVFTAQEALNERAVRHIEEAARNAIARQGSFSIVLAGGSTPKSVYQLLPGIETDWGKWHVYYGDDRCLPPEHEERNSLMAHEAWLKHVAIPAAQVHDIPAEQGPEAAAQAYNQILQNAGEFDLVLLGLGEDGHTASLFPGHIWDDNQAAVPVFGAPKPPPERVSISAGRLSQAREVVFFVTGAGKQEAVDNWRRGEAIPASLIKPTNGVDIFIFGVNL